MRYNRELKPLMKLKNDIETFLGVPDIDSKDRSQHLTEARFMFFVIARKRDYSYNTIGTAVNRNHATVMHGIKMHNDYMNYYKRYKILYDNLLVSINAESNNNKELKELIVKTSSLKKEDLKLILETMINPFLEHKKATESLVIN